jgi:hypothetical protein
MTSAFAGHEVGKGAWARRAAGSYGERDPRPPCQGREHLRHCEGAAGVGHDCAKGAREGSVKALVLCLVCDKLRSEDVARCPGCGASWAFPAPPMVAGDRGASWALPHPPWPQVSPSPKSRSTKTAPGRPRCCLEPEHRARKLPGSRSDRATTPRRRTWTQYALQAPQVRRPLPGRHRGRLLRRSMWMNASCQDGRQAW